MIISNIESPDIPVSFKKSEIWSCGSSRGNGERRGFIAQNCTI